METQKLSLLFLQISVNLTLIQNKSFKNVGFAARVARDDMEEEDNSETEVTYLNQTFLMSNMKTKPYKSASKQDIRTKAFQKGK